MNSETMIIVALGIALVVVGLSFAAGSGVLDEAKKAVDNMSDRADSGDIPTPGNTQESSFKYGKYFSQEGVVKT